MSTTMVETFGIEDELEIGAPGGRAVYPKHYWAESPFVKTQVMIPGSQKIHVVLKPVNGRYTVQTPEQERVLLTSSVKVWPEDLDASHVLVLEPYGYAPPSFGAQQAHQSWVKNNVRTEE